MSKFEEFIKNMGGKNVAVMGIGVSNTPLVKLLCHAGAVVTAHDKKSKEQLPVADELIGLGVTLKTDEQYMTELNGFDYIFRTPGMRPDLPELLDAQNNGSIITSEMECFFEVCPCPIIAVTGSDGKTTTTTLISKILQNAGYVCHLGGNIGTPLLSKTPDMKSTDFAVVELSSFQLFTMQKSPSVAVITNLSPNHLDIHKNMEEYKQAKKNIFLHQSKNDTLILNSDNMYTEEFAKEAPSKILMFSNKKRFENGVFVKDNSIVYACDGQEKMVVALDEIILPGNHNVENYMAAVAATIPYCSFENVASVARTFGGVEHRIEFIKTIDNVKYYNDSIASSPTRTIACIRSFNTPILLIAGGYDKHIPFEPLAEEIVNPNSPVREIILTGDTAEKIRLAIETSQGYNCEKIQIFICDTLTQATQLAKEHANPLDNIILSPACASFDRYKNFEERGNIFKQIVHSL